MRIQRRTFCQIRCHENIGREVVVDIETSQTGIAIRQVSKEYVLCRIASLLTAPPAAGAPAASHPTRGRRGSRLAACLRLAGWAGPPLARRGVAPGDAGWAGRARGGRGGCGGRWKRPFEFPILLASETGLVSNGVLISCRAMCGAIELDPGQQYKVSIGGSSSRWWS